MVDVSGEDLVISREQWGDIGSRLRAPFNPGDVDFRVQGKANEQTGRAQVVAYIDARVVQDRLDEVVGIGNWSFDWTPLVIEKGEVMVAKGTLTILGVSKSDAGSASNFEQSLGAVSHCFKRAAVHWGIGRYLYDLPMTWVTVEKGGRIPEGILRDLRSKLPRPNSTSGTSHSEAHGRVDDAPVEHRRQGQPQPQIANRPMPAHPASTPAAREVPIAAVRREESDETSATEKQVASIRKLCEALGKPEPEGDLTYTRARELITQLSGEYQRARRAS